MVKVFFCTLKGGGRSKTYRGKPDFIITTGYAWLDRVTFNSQLGIVPAGSFFIEKGDNQYEKRTDYYDNQQQSDGGKRYEAEIYSF